jgi:hypothetical protein
MPTANECHGLLHKQPLYILGQTLIKALGFNACSSPCQLDWDLTLVSSKVHGFSMQAFPVQASSIPINCKDLVWIVLQGTCAQI